MREFNTVREAYDYIHRQSKINFLAYGATDDKANREATKLAVIGAWTLFNKEYLERIKG